MTTQPLPAAPVKASLYNDGYNAGWAGARSSENPHFVGDCEMTPEAEEWERGRFDGRRDRQD